MTLKEILRSKGLSDEDIESVIGEMKQNKIFTASEENLDFRYGKLKTDHDALVTKNTETQKLLEQLQSASSDTTLQDKVAEYEATIQKQTEELQQFRMESALKIALLGAGARPEAMDYLLFKLSHDDTWTPELNEKGQVVGLDDKMKSFRTMNSGSFVGESHVIRVDERRIDRPYMNHDGLTQKEFMSMNYRQKLNLFNENPDLYRSLSHGNGTSQVRR